MDDSLEPAGKGLDAMGAVAILAALALGLFGIHYFSAQQRALRTCEAALGNKLKAPSTYSRIDYYAASDGEWVDITYEAENSFGVPLRGEGHCVLNPDLTDAVWYDDNAR